MKRLSAFAILGLLFLLAACGGRATIDSVKSGTKIVAFGDSLTAGYGVSEDESYPTVLARLLGCEVSNYGISGEDTAAGLERAEEMLADEKPDLVLLCFGGNDMLRDQPESRTRENLARMITQIKETGADVVLIGVPRPGLILSVPDLYEELAKEYGVPIDTKTLKGVLKNSSMKSDAIHPNAEGYRVMAQEIFELLRKSSR